MVAVNETKDTGRVVAGAVCPGCDEKYLFPSVMSMPDKYGRDLREVRGWCCKCNTGYITRQFKTEDGTWLTYEYCRYAYQAGDKSKPVPVGQWVKGFDLPDPAAVAVGPGGDYIKQVDIDKLLASSVAILNKTARAIVELMDIAKARKADND